MVLISVQSSTDENESVASGPPESRISDGALDELPVFRSHRRSSTKLTSYQPSLSEASASERPFKRVR
jgi:hypothetical protein